MLISPKWSVYSTVVSRSVQEKQSFKPVLAFVAKFLRIDFIKYVIETVILQGISSANFIRSDNLDLAVCYIHGKESEISPQIWYFWIQSYL